MSLTKVTYSMISGASIYVADYGAVGNGSIDDTMAIQEALTAAAGKTLILAQNAVYKCTAGLMISGDINGQGATLKFYGAAISYLVSQSVEASLSDFIIDGANVTSCQAGLFVDTDFVQADKCRWDLTINNISNSNNTQGCSGALIYKSSSASVNLNSDLDIRINVSGVTATGNGTEGDTGGKASGILVAFNGTGCNGNVIIHDSVVKNVSSGATYPEEDSDGIHIFQGDFNVETAGGKWTVENCSVSDARKRGVKVQAPNAYINNCRATGLMLAGFETYAYYTTFDGCAYRGTRMAFSTSLAGANIVNCFGRGSSTDQPVIAVYSASNNTKISNSIFIAAVSRVSEYVGVIKFYPGGLGSSTVLDNVTLICGTNTGSGIYIDGGPHYVTARGVSVEGVRTGAFLYQADGSFTAIDSSFSVTGGSTVLVTNAVPKPTITLKNINGSGGNVNAGDSVLTLDNSIISKFGGGTAVYSTATGCRVSNSTINTDTATDGVNVGNSLVQNNRINTAKNGVVYSYTTAAEVSGNVAVGCITPYVTTGFTAFVNVNNFSR